MMKGNVLMIITIPVILATVGLFVMTAAAAELVPRMTKEELKKLLGNSDIILMDVRTGKSWKDSEFKIKGAVREDPKKFDSWADKYPKDKTLILYCS
ncbi:MAG: hypothetical protein JRG73_19165 [Deltaproteobacteria bacterium]|nr:hypothetical protein [Deltaproteobacteria bacterium]MBW2309049.1 hypothetical protein [Deltaproteobacteria bacterium]